jgi:uncharacterized protein (TIGR02246 family)
LFFSFLPAAWGTRKLDGDNSIGSEGITMGNIRHIRFAAVAIAAAAVLAISGCAASASSSPEKEARPVNATVQAMPSVQEIQALFAAWNGALATLDPQKVADQYAPDALLLPTVSNQMRTNRAEIVDYFQHFLEDKPQGEILRSNVRILDPNTAIDAGTYRFTLTKDGTQSTVDARYTFVYERIDNGWLIVDHHSSAMPEKD